MCGRIVLNSPPAVVAARFFLDAVPELAARFNICPGTDIAAVLPNPLSEGNLLRTFNWGLMPPWEKDPLASPKLINARSETVDSKSAFKDAFRHRRCLIPVDGFYEWQKRQEGNQPYFFSARNAQPFALAGIWERHEYPGGRIIDSCTILTTAANKLMRPIHHRMPVVLPEKDWKFWLRLDAEKSESLSRLLVPATEDLLQAWPVAREVNKPTHDGPACIERIWDDRGGPASSREAGRQWLLVASLRTAEQVWGLAAQGLDTFTLNTGVVSAMLKEQLTDDAAADFQRAAEKMQ